MSIRERGGLSKGFCNEIFWFLILVLFFVEILLIFFNFNFIICLIGDYL